MVGLSSLQRLNFDSASKAYNWLLKRQTKESKAIFERKSGLAGSALLRLCYSGEQYASREAIFEATEDYADGKIDHAELQRRVNPNAYYRNTDWFLAFLQWHKNTDADKLRVIFDVFGTAEQPEPATLRDYQQGLPGKVARILYDTRGFFTLDTLHEALLTVGCQQSGWLEHCKVARHSKGCWLVDLLLGKV